MDNISNPSKKPNILMIATGGTIASLQGENGYTPAITSEEILSKVPQVATFCTVETLQLFNLDSTNIAPCHWLAISQTLEDNYQKYDGFVITHGTDTMAYTAAALSYLVQQSPKPIVITGSQKSIAHDETDARQNLLHAFLYASDPHSHGVSLAFDGKIILGTRARKERSKSYNAFSSIDYPELAVIRDHRILRYLEELPSSKSPIFYHKLEQKILLLSLIPGASAHGLDLLVDHYSGLILQSFGVGGLPEGELSTSLEKWTKAGKTVVMTTQVPYEGSNMEVYQVGLEVKRKYNIIESYNMTLEATTTKLMWALGQTSNPKEVKKLFYTPISKDILF